jgi:hypothetical protein
MGFSLPSKEKSKEYLASLSERIPGYLFPFFLLILELILRYAFNLNTQEFIGPTLAATGVGMIMSLTAHRSNKIPRVVPQEVEQFLKEKKLTIEPYSVKVFRSICWTLTLVLTILWVVSITLSIKFPSNTMLSLPTHYYPGFMSYVIAFVLSEVKEAI